MAEQTAEEKAKEQGYQEGKQFALLQMMRAAMNGLGPYYADHSRLADVHADTIAALCELLEELGIERDVVIHPADLIRRALRAVVEMKEANRG